MKRICTILCLLAILFSALTLVSCGGASQNAPTGGTGEETPAHYTVVFQDETVVTYMYILGQYQGHLPGVGTFFNFLKTTPGYIVCILIPFMLLIIYEGINFFRLFRRYKKEQMAEVEEERAKLQAERAESAKMMAELQALKEQLEAQKAGAAPEAKPEDSSEQ